MGSEGAIGELRREELQELQHCGNQKIQVAILLLLNSCNSSYFVDSRSFRVSGVRS